MAMVLPYSDLVIVQRQINNQMRIGEYSNLLKNNSKEKKNTSIHPGPLI